MDLHVGTSGYSYKEWKGPFYPERLPASEMLGFYAQRLSAVEINNTFYRMPKTSVLETWAERVPGSFRFAIKASRRITHFKRLVDAGDETSYLLRCVGVLGERLGALLFQLPPNLKLDLPRLERFMQLLPENTPAAFEFRHPSWLDDAVFERLRERGFALVAVDADADDAAELVETASFGYLRLRRAGYDAETLRDWAQRVASRAWSDAYVFFKHEDDGAGPALAADFIAEANALAPRRRAVAVRTARRREVG